jgi:ComF family protein
LLDGVMVMGEYQGLLKRAIRAGKYQFAYEVVDELAETLADFVDNQSELAQIDWLVVMPLSRRRLLWRGFNQSQLLAQRLMTVYQCPELSHDLLKIADTVPQAQLAWRERFNLSADNFTWRGQSLADQTVLVVDDVMTTGRTLEAVAEVLKRAGAERVYGVVLARN